MINKRRKRGSRIMPTTEEEKISPDQVYCIVIDISDR